MSKKGIIFVHGTGQDISSQNETTVKLFKQAQAEGHIVAQIGGPGSTERNFLRLQKLTGTVDSYTPIDEIGLPLDYGLLNLTGNALGTGVDDITEEIQELVQKMLSQGVSELILVGFSRGAVSLALALEKIDKSFKSLIIKIPISVCLLDPVPGPFLIKKSAVIPRWVNRLMLLVAEHEGRPGFAQFEIKKYPETKLISDLVMGVHGDIGGSTLSTMTHIVYDDVTRFLGLKGHRLSIDSRQDMILDMMFNSDQYTRPSWTYRLMPRTFEGGPFFPSWRPVTSEQNIIEMPSERLYNEVQFNPMIRLFMGATPETIPQSSMFANRQIQKKPWLESYLQKLSIRHDLEAKRELEEQRNKEELHKFKIQLQFKQQMENLKQQQQRMENERRRIIENERQRKIKRETDRMLIQIRQRHAPVAVLAEQGRQIVRFIPTNTRVLNASQVGSTVLKLLKYIP